MYRFTGVICQIYGATVNLIFGRSLIRLGPSVFNRQTYLQLLVFGHRRGRWLTVVAWAPQTSLGVGECRDIGEPSRVPKFTRHYPVLIFSLLSRSRFSQLPGRLLFALYYLGTPRHALPGSSKEGKNRHSHAPLPFCVPKRRENNVFRGPPAAAATRLNRSASSSASGPRRAADDLTAHGARGG
ncbi:unnamed protein product [Boreogadus saida]